MAIPSDITWRIRPYDGGPYKHVLRTNTWDGSIHPDDFMDLCERGACVLGPTDKNYKVYVRTPNPVAGRRAKSGSSSGPVFDGGWPYKLPPLWRRITCIGVKFAPHSKPEEQALIHRIRGRYKIPHYSPAPTENNHKFYFEHLSEPQRFRFVELHNSKKLAFEGWPDGEARGFYRLPFFMTRAA